MYREGGGGKKIKRSSKNFKHFKPGRGQWRPKGRFLRKKKVAGGGGGGSRFKGRPYICSILNLEGANGCRRRVF